MRAVGVGLAVVLCFSISARAALWIVDQGGGGDFLTLSAAIAVAADGDEILVHPGTYTENIDFLGMDLWIHSSAGPGETVIDGSAGGHPFGSCVMVRTGESMAATLEGFELTGGTGSLEEGYLMGGGVFCHSAAITVINCRFTENEAENGGGIAFYYGDGTVRECVFEENTAERYGGGLNGGYGTIQIEDCDFKANHVLSGGGGGLSIGNEAWVSISSCSFRGNRAPHGGGINIGQGTTSGTISGCLFESNFATQAHGGGLRLHEADMTIAECIFFDNEAIQDGGGLHLIDGANAWVRNCTFHGNSAYRYGGNVSVYYSMPLIEQTIVSGATIGGGIFGEGANLAVVCCDVVDNIGGNYVGTPDLTGMLGNISYDPLFCDEAGGDYHIYNCSPCAPFSHPNSACDLIGALPVGCELMDIEDPQAELPEPRLRCLAPNPFAPGARIFCTVGFDGPGAALVVYDTGGRLVRTLTSGRLARGHHIVPWDGRDENGMLLPSGAYFLRLSQGNECQNVRIALID